MRQRVRLALFLFLGLVWPSSAPIHAAASLVPVPEVFWFSVYQDDRRIGFGRGEYSVLGLKAYAFDYLLVLHLPTVKVGEKSQWTFDSTLRPLSFTRKTLMATGTQKVVNEDNGTFDWKTTHLSARWRDFDQEESKDLEIPANITSRFATNLLLAHSALAEGKTFSYTVFSIDKKAFIKQTFRVVAQEKEHRYRLELASEETPGPPASIVFEAASKLHPNGFSWTTTQITREGRTMRLQAASREQALRGFESEASSMGL